MKYLLLFVVLMVAYGMWRNKRLAERQADAPRPPPAAPKGPQEMVSCPVCGVHLPRSEAVPATNGALYCSQEHRLRAGA